MADDTLIGNADANIINGGFGDDRVMGGEGDDRLIGGVGIDTISYADAHAGVVVDLAAQVPQDTIGAGIILMIENLTGSNHDDRLTGAYDNNTIDGLAGNDVLLGGAGDDHLIGGDGMDTASYELDAAAVDADLYFETATDVLAIRIPSPT